MKTIITIVLLSVGLIYSQTISDSSQIKNRNKEQEKVHVQNQDQQKNQSQNQIGPKENPQGEVKQNRKRKDVFIDKDGDGICDSRQSGLSFNKMRKRQGSGQKGPGGPGGSGGSGGNGNINGNGYGGGR
jgi:hypothetical protein